MTVDLSVIIPTFNRAAFLPGCIGSVRACGVPAEVVLVDDGSTDDTPDRVKELGDVIYIRQANAGPALGRNHGAARSRGRYLAFLDSDDTWRPGVVPRLLDALAKYPETDLAFADALVGNPTDGFAPLTPVAGEGTFDQISSQPLGPGLRLLEREAFFHRMIKRNLVFLGSAIVPAPPSTSWVGSIHNCAALPTMNSFCAWPNAARLPIWTNRWPIT